MKYDFGISIVLGQWVLAVVLLGLIIWAHSIVWDKKVVKTRKKYSGDASELHNIPAVLYFSFITIELVLSAGFLASLAPFVVTT